MTRERVRDLSEAGLTASQIAAAIGLAKSTVCYHLRRLGLPPDPRYGRRYDWAAVKAHYEAGHTVRECQGHFGFSGSAWAEAVRRGALTPRSRSAELEILIRSGARPSRAALKRALLSEGLKARSCERCGVGEWRARPLSLALHHVNGDGQDNRLENLRLLCPNCHSQTENYGGRNRGKLARLKRAGVSALVQTSARDGV